MRGRRPAGPEYVQQLDGSPLARERLQVILETLSGQCRVQEACQRLGICEQRFHQLREEALAAALARLELGVPGRPPRLSSAAEQQLAALEQQVAEQEVELRAARAREEIALTLPGRAARAEHTPAPPRHTDNSASATPSASPATPEKKTRRRRRRPGTRKHT